MQVITPSNPVSGHELICHTVEPVSENGVDPKVGHELNRCIPSKQDP